MITIEWHWLVYIPVILAGIVYLIFGEEGGNGFLDIPVLKPLCLVGMITFTLVWGGIFWW
jgi:hypothetical protein